MKSWTALFSVGLMVFHATGRQKMLDRVAQIVVLSPWITPQHYAGVAEWYTRLSQKQILVRD